jgi:hypothetical protein
MKRLVLFVTVALGLTACTGSEIVVRPDPSTIDTNFRSNCGTIAIKESTASRVYPAAGNLVPDFANALEQSGLAEKVLYPIRPDDKPDITLDVKFDVVADLNRGGNAAKSIFIGLTFFLIEPILWLDYDYSVTGQVDIIKGNARAQTLNPKAYAEMSIKWLSIDSLQNLEQDTLTKLKSSVYKQFLTGLNIYCKTR